MKPLLRIAAASLLLFSRVIGAEPVSPTGVVSTADVKKYLLEGLKKVASASDDFVKNSVAYEQLIRARGGDYRRATSEARAEAQALVSAMQENYKAMDSFGYETVEGIVAGVERSAPFDVYLDSGVGKNEASSATPVAPVVLRTADARVLDCPGSLFTSLIEPMLWGTKKEYVVPVDLNGDGVIGPKETLPDAVLLAAIATDTQKKIAELLAASEAWQPTIEDCFAAIITMTPTLSGYFDDWKESRYARESSGKFSAVSRVSDMRGIMSSVAILYRAVQPQVEREDAALAKSIERGFRDILSFIDRVDAREKKRAITPAEVDELGSKAKEKADKLVPQVEQAAAVLQINRQPA